MHISSRRAQDVARALRAKLKHDGVDVAHTRIQTVADGSRHLAEDTQGPSRENRSAEIEIIHHDQPPQGKPRQAHPGHLPATHRRVDRSSHAHSAAGRRPAKQRATGPEG